MELIYWPNQFSKWNFKSHFGLLSHMHFERNQLVKYIHTCMSGYFIRSFSSYPNLHSWRHFSSTTDISQRREFPISTSVSLLEFQAFENSQSFTPNEENKKNTIEIWFGHNPNYIVCVLLFACLYRCQIDSVNRLK